MIFERFFNPKPKSSQVLYGAIVAAARHPKFYLEMAVPDTVEGRFEMVAAHVYLVLARMKDLALSEDRQNLVDTFFADMDRSLREMGVGDVSVGKKVRIMAESFYGRINAYDRALVEGEGPMRAALARNVFPDSKDEGIATPLTRWFFFAQSQLAAQNAAEIARGKVEFL